jgi:hypothetical protein
MSIVVKWFPIQITESGKSFSVTYELEKMITHINGLSLISNRADLAYYRGTMRFEVNKKEVLPEGFHCQRLMSGQNVSPNDRTYDVKHVTVGNGIVKADYQDTNDTRLPFEKYTVYVYMDCEQTDI